MVAESQNDRVPKTNRQFSISLATGIGLLLALSSPLIQRILTPILRNSFEREIANILSLSIMWVIVLVVLSIAYFGEGLKLSDFGFRRYQKDRNTFIREFVYAALIGAALTLTIFPFSLLVRSWITGETPQATGDLSTLPSSLVFALMWITGSFTEEVLFRSYSIERLIAITGKPWLAGLITAFLFTIQHLGGWDWIHVLTIVLPGAIALTLIYVWRRSLMFNVIVHAMVNLQFLIAAIALLFIPLPN
jgi:membrane protease YdiL (CAAX protease family)